MPKKDATDTLGTELALTDYVAPVVEEEVVELAVEMITAINTKQIEVKFNKEVDKTTAETAANYTVAGVAFGTAKLQEDGMTVIATMATDTATTNATEVEFKVLKTVKDADGTALAADYAEKITVVDTTSPEYVSVKAVGQKTLELTFSEPIIDNNGAGAATDLLTTQFKVTNGIYTYVVSTATADFAANTITLTLGTNLLEGETTIKINSLGMSDAGALRDFAGLVVVPSTVTYTYAADTSVPTVELSSVNKATKVAKVTFSKPVHGDNVKLYHSVNGTAAYATANVSKVIGDAAKEWEFTFTNALPSGTLTFYLVNDTVAANQIADLFGVKVPNQTFTYEVVADTTAPTVSKVTVNTNASIDIDFSETVDTTEAVKAANFEILKPDGTALAFTTSAVDGDTTRLTASLVDNTTYTVNVKAMKDVAGNAMAAAYTTTAAVADNENPTATAYSTDANTLYVVFSEAMNADDLVNKALYLIDIDGNGADAGASGAGAAVALDSADTITAISDKKVKITFNDGGIVANTDLTIGAAKDLAGKTLTADAQFSTNVDAPVDSLTFTAELTAPTKLKIKFNKELGLFTAADFTLAGSNFLAIESNTVVSGKSEVVLVLETAQAADATPNLTAADPGAGLTTKSAENTVVTAAVVATVDKIAPSIDKVIYVSATQIEVQLTEDMTAATFAGAGTNGFSVTGGTLTTALKGTADNVVVLTGTDFTINTDVTYTAGNLTDQATAPIAMATETVSDALTAADLGAVYAAGTVTLTPNYEATALDAGNDDIIAIFAKPAANVGSWFAWVKEDPTFAGTTALTVTQASGTTFTVVATGNAAANLDFTVVIENEDGVQAEIALTAVSGGTVINAQ
jgi:hypothetical protein